MSTTYKSFSGRPVYLDPGEHYDADQRLIVRGVLDVLGARFRFVVDPDDRRRTVRVQELVDYELRIRRWEDCSWDRLAVRGNAQPRPLSVHLPV